MLIGAVILTYCTLNPVAAGAVYAPTGQALQTIYAVEDTLLDKVIAATRVGVRSTTTGRTATGWGMARFTGSAIAPLLSIGITAAGLAWSPYILPWIEEQGWWVDDDEIKREMAGGHYEPKSGVQYGAWTWQNPTKTRTYTVWVFPSAAEAQAAITVFNGGSCANHCSSVPAPNAYATPVGGWSSDVYPSCARACVSGSSPYDWHIGLVTSASNLDWIANVETVGSATIESTFVSTFADDASLARSLGIDTINYMGDKAKTANSPWPGTVPTSNGYSPLNDTQGATVQTALNDAIDAQAKQELQDEADQNGTVIPGGSDGTKTDWEYTPEQMATAQYDRDLQREAAWVTDWNAEKPDDGNTTQPGAGDYTLPERKDLGGVLDSFKASLDSLPIISWVNGVQLEVSGASSVVTLPLPEGWGSSITVDFADYENILDMMGAGLYALVGMASILFLFRGRGD